MENKIFGGQSSVFPLSSFSFRGVLAAMAVGLLLAACENEPEVEKPEEIPPEQEEVTEPVVELKKLVIHASLGAESRVTGELDEVNRVTNFRWEVGDEVKVYSEGNDPAIFTVTELTGQGAVLSGEVAVEDGDDLFGVYNGKTPLETTGSLCNQKGTLESIGENLILSGKTIYKDGESINMQFSHHCSFMMFNLTFPSEVTNVTDISIENALTEYGFSNQDVLSSSAGTIAIEGEFTPDENGYLALHVAMLPETTFCDLSLTCTTNDGIYNMPPLKSTNKMEAGVYNRTTRTMVALETHELRLLSEDKSTQTLIEGARYRNGVVTWKADAPLKEGDYISICEPGEWKCFHYLTASEASARSFTMPDLNGGCTIDPSDPTRNDWIVALSLGSTVSEGKAVDGVQVPLYWATGNLIAIYHEDSTASFRLSTLDELAQSETPSSPFHHNPELGLNAGDMWDMFLYGDPTGLAKTSEFATPKSVICGKAKDIAHTQLGYDWRLPYWESDIINEISILTKFNTWDKNGHIVGEKGSLFFPLAGEFEISTWKYTGSEAYMLTGGYKTSQYVYFYFDTQSREYSYMNPATGSKDSPAMNVRPVTI